MTTSNGSYSGPLPLVRPQDEDRLIGEVWIEHGFKANPIFEEVEDCAICDAPNQTCTHFNTVSLEVTDDAVQP